MKNWFKKHIRALKPSKNSSELKILKPFLKASYLWSYDRDSVARGIAAGLAGAVIPGFQIFYAALLVILLRGNLPIGLVCTLITNPLTVLPITYFIYFIGNLVILNGDIHFVSQDFQWDFSSFHAFWSNVSAWILQFGKAFFVGMPIVSVCLGVIGYFGTLFIWKIIDFLFRKRKKK